MMAYDRPRTADLNVVARYALGWLNTSHVLHTSANNYLGRLSDLDETLEYNLLLVMSDCRFCSSIYPVRIKSVHEPILAAPCAWRQDLTSVASIDA